MCGLTACVVCLLTGSQGAGKPVIRNPYITITSLLPRLYLFVTSPLPRHYLATSADRCSNIYYSLPH